MSNNLSSSVAPDKVPRYLEAARAGSKEALERLLESYRVYLRRVALRGIDRDLRRKIDPSDLAQITLIEAHNDFQQFTSPTHSHLRAWLTTLLRNNLTDARKHFRETAKRDVSRELLSDSHLAMLADTKQSLPEAANPAWDRYRDAIASLPPHYQEVIRLRHAERMSFVEMGERLDKSTDAMRMLYGRAIKTLKEQCDDDVAS